MTLFAPICRIALTEPRFLETAMRIRLLSHSFGDVAVPRWWNVACAALAIVLFAVLLFHDG